MTHIAREQVARTPAATAGTTVAKPFLPTTRRGWLVAISIVAVIALASLGWLTNGRTGLVGVKGNSMSSVIPQGSSVITLPLAPREGDFVVASVGMPDDQSDMIQKDGSQSLVVKKYCDGRLVSTDDASVYSRFEYRGRVIARIPTQKILFWRDKDAQKPAPNAKVRTIDQQIGLTRDQIEKKIWIDEFKAKTRFVKPVSVSGTGDVSRVACGGVWTNPMGSGKTYKLKVKYGGQKVRAVAFRLTHTGPAYFRLNGKDVGIDGLREMPDGRKWLLDPGEVRTLEFEFGPCNMMASIEKLEIRM